MQYLDSIIYLVVLIYSIILHEMGHAWVSDREGDNTARRAGRITLNPLPHIDIVGSIIAPLISFFTVGAALGWAKGVPYNPYNLRDRRWSEVKVAAAGVIANFTIAIVATILYKICGYFATDINVYSYEYNIAASTEFWNLSLFNMCLSLARLASTYAVIINISLGIFNLLPLPPFDGMRIIASLFPSIGRKINNYADVNQTIFLILSLYIAYNVWPYVSPLVNYIINFLI